MSRAAIEAAIPHRPPFLFVDAVVEESDEGLVASWRVPPDAEWFKGHYPGQPVTPGALISEHVFQCAAVWISHQLQGFDAGDGVPVLTKIADARFRRMVLPGETLTTTVRLEEKVGPAWYMRGDVRCGDEKVLRISYVLTATDAAARAVEPGSVEPGDRA